MAALFEFSQSELTRFLLILARVSPLMITAPVWGSPVIPGQVRAFIAILVSALLLPVVRGPLPAGLTGDAVPLAMAVAWELLVGFLIAFLAQLMFAAAQFAGQLIDIQMGFGMANVIDPMTSAQVTLVGQIQYSAIEAESMINRATRAGKTFETSEALINEIFRIVSGK